MTIVRAVPPHPCPLPSEGRETLNAGLPVFRLPPREGEGSKVGWGNTLQSRLNHASPNHD